MLDSAPFVSSLHALSVYAEPLVAGRRVLVIGDATRGLGERFAEMGARLVHLYDPSASRAAAARARSPRGVSVFALPAEFDVRDGAFDLAVVSDLAEVPAPAPLIARLRRILAQDGVALVRTRVEGPSDAPAKASGPDYYELYDLMAMQFAEVKMVGQIPWSGVALAELGDGADEPDVTVDTQLVTEGAAPEAFVAVGSHRDVELSSYALVQLPAQHDGPAPDIEATLTGARSTGTQGDDRAALAAAQLRASLLEAQVEELRAQRNEDAVAHAEAIASVETELAERLSQLQHVERRIAEANARAEQGFADARAKDEEIARLRDRGALVLRELEDERRGRARAEQELGQVRASVEGATRDRAALPAAAERVRSLEAAIERLVAGTEEQAERLQVAEEARSKLEIALATALVELDGLRRSRAVVEEQAGLAGSSARRVRELEAAIEALRAEAQAAIAMQGQEVSSLEATLRERARAVDVLERELARRERIILDLVHAFEEARTVGATTEPGGEETPADALHDAPREVERARAENDQLRQKLDAAALEIARREGQSATTAWRIQELEETIARLDAEQSELTMTIPPPAFLNVEREANDVTVLTERLSAALDELEIVRQALAQEHQARVQAESGEALAQARADLARQAALLEKLSGELDAADRTRRGADEASAQR